RGAQPEERGLPPVAGADAGALGQEGDRRPEARRERGERDRPARRPGRGLLPGRRGRPLGHGRPRQSTLEIQRRAAGPDGADPRRGSGDRRDRGPARRGRLTLGPLKRRVPAALLIGATAAAFATKPPPTTYKRDWVRHPPIVERDTASGIVALGDV